MMNCGSVPNTGRPVSVHGSIVRRVLLRVEFEISSGNADEKSVVES